MAVKFGMPSLGHTMESGTVLEWLKQEGETLAKGDSLLMVETDKVTTEVEAPMDGVLHKIVVPAGQERPIGAILAILLVPGESPDPAETARLLAPEGAPATRKKAPRAATRPSPRRKRPAKSGRLRISPVARRLAARHGVDPANVDGSGPGGRITKDDILRAAAAAASPPQPAQAPESTLGVARTIPLTGTRGRVAQRLSQSWREIPRVTEVMHVDMSRTVDFRETNLSRWESSYGMRISLNDLVTKAVAVALERHPLLNATLVDNQVRVHDGINIGLAVHLDQGLVVPVLKDAGQKNLEQLAQEGRSLAGKARNGTLDLADVSDGTFTITNLGGAHVDLFTPIINPPQVAILGIGRIQPRPLAVDGQLEVVPTAYLCLVFDHRAVDGYPAGLFLKELRDLFAHPEEYAGK
jgi:pyruvate dehydrogenase E2 component (dihydrolipoamide acetyltransferase)